MVVYAGTFNLGMLFDYSEPGQVLVQMYQYISGVIEGVSESYKTGVGLSTPTPLHLYDVRDPKKKEVRKLSKWMKEEYHSLTAQCLY